MCLYYYGIYGNSKGEGNPITYTEVGVEVRAPLIQNLDSRMRWVFKSTPRSLYPGETDLVPILQYDGLSRGTV